MANGKSFLLLTYSTVLSLVAAIPGCGVGSVGDPRSDGSWVPSGPETTIIVLGDGGGPPTSYDTGTCDAATSCVWPGGQYCGIIGDGCNGTLACGACPVGQTCIDHVCLAGNIDGGMLTSCTVPGGQYCGDIGDGAGGKIACGPCSTPGWVCTAGLCTADATVCTPSECTAANGKYCGVIGDGCGHGKDCGGCAAGQLCVNNQCVPAVCTPLTCNPAGGQYCGGVLGDGCGSSITCGDCATPGWTCQAHMCKGGPSCVPTTCGAGAGKYCGTIGDGCGNTLACGDCIAGETCQNNQCISTTCVPLTCKPTGGQYCGVVGDGCGGALTCSEPCPAGWVCLNNLCVGGLTCDRLTTCANGTAYNYCGSVGDGCGGTLACGNDCAAGQVCDTTTGLCKGVAAVRGAGLRRHFGAADRGGSWLHRGGTVLPFQGGQARAVAGRVRVQHSRFSACSGSMQRGSFAARVCSVFHAEDGEQSRRTHGQPASLDFHRITQSERRGTLLAI